MEIPRNFRNFQIGGSFFFKKFCYHFSRETCFKKEHVLLSDDNNHSKIRRSGNVSFFDLNPFLEHRFTSRCPYISRCVIRQLLRSFTESCGLVVRAAALASPDPRFCLLSPVALPSATRSVLSFYAHCNFRAQQQEQLLAT